MRRTVLFLVLATSVTLVLPQVSSAAAPKCFGRKATIVGTNGDDVLKGTAKTDVIVALDGNDTVKGLGGKDRICGGSGDDVLRGGEGSDKIYGADGNDQLLSEGGNDDLGGGPGNDTLTGAATDGVNARFDEARNAVTVDLSAGRATGEGKDRLVRIYSVVGSTYDDTLIGDAGANGFTGLEGDDTIDGAGGVDLLFYTFARGPVTVDLTAGTATGEGTDDLTGIEDVFGSPFSDSLTGDANSNRFWGLEGDDTIDGAGGVDLAIYWYAQRSVTVDLTKGSATGEGTDTLMGIEGIGGGDFDDTLTGDANSNGIWGNGGDDAVSGLDGNDKIWGGYGDDTVDSGNGTDLVRGGAGTDTCTNAEDTDSCES